ncbi:MAG: type 2 isopentenyl-diphosphate Delta-isomerase [Polyangiaceae bacterium]|jgi:isopentenyl-diphosphate delta-isomerase|nr:type 2 isopentenyl-diphosphate Delta-isomerase [Polyangiaceae bacterium]
MAPNISTRKADHIALAQNEDVGFRQKGTLLDEVRLVHEALPDLSLEDVDTTIEVLGKRLRAPMFIAGMTGGSPQSKDINLQLAAIAEEMGIGFGLGSQRAMLLRPELSDTYRVRAVAPSVLLLGNIGVVQARDVEISRIEALLDDVGADALCVHMNPAMEVVQPEGDRDFRGGLATFERLVSELRKPVIAKETGCGISRFTAKRLRRAGVRHVDVSGAGGTSWVGVEAKRANREERSLGELLWDWGIPTAASVAMTSEVGMQTIIATGGVATGLDIARAVAVGATAGGIARPVIKALGQGGPAEARALVERIMRELRAVMALVGARDLRALRAAPRTLGPELQTWLTRGVDTPSASAICGFVRRALGRAVRGTTPWF